MTTRLRWLGLPLVLTLAAVASGDYWPQGDPRSGGMRDVMLLYIGDKPHYTSADLLPYVAYLDKSKNGRPADWFYDTFQFMMFGGSPSGKMYIDGATDLNDWRFYVDTLFAPALNLAALDAAVSEAAKTLGPPKQKVPILLMIPYPSQAMKAFGDVDGSGKSLDLSRPDDAARAVAWVIDETSRRFSAAGFKNLKLWGYYWMNEGISPPDEPIVKATSRLLHDRKLGFHWIPWFNAPGVDHWRDFGFDFVVMQPNYAFMPEPRDEQRLADAAAICRKLDMGIEIEVPYQTGQSATSRDILSDYLNYGLPAAEGYESAVHGYYQGTMDIALMYQSDVPALNALYRDLYLFHKQKYVRRDRSVASISHEARLAGGKTTLWLDLPMPLRIEEVRLHLRQPTGDLEKPFLARAYACDSHADKGRLLGEAVTANLASTLSMRGRPQLARSLRVEVTGAEDAEAVLDWVRAFAAGGSGPATAVTTEGAIGGARLIDGLYASSSTDTASLVRWSSGKGSLSVAVPPDRYLSRLWLHAVRAAGGQWPSTVSVTLGGKTVDARPAPAASDWSTYLPIDLPRARGSKITVTFRGATSAPIALDEIEVEPAANLASGKPYSVDPPKPAQYPDDGKKLTDGQLSQGFSDGKTVGWMSGNASIIVDLGEPRDIDLVRAHVEGGGQGAVYLPQSMVASTSSDGESWAPARRILPPTEPPGAICVMKWLEARAPVAGVRFVRIDFVPTCWLMVDEIEVLSGGENVALGRPYRLLVAPTSSANYRDDGRKLTDGLVSEGGWNADRVVGYSDVDPTFTLDLLAPQPVGLVAAHVCGGGNAAVFYPEEMSVQTSLDGVTWSVPIVTRDHPADSGTEATVALMEVPVSGSARYLSLHFKRRGWCMVDEIEVYGPEG